MKALGYELLEQASLSDVGVRRSHNQDAYAVSVASETETWQERGHLFLVADGMGAHAVGELASKMATDLIPHTYYKHASQGALHAIRRAFEEANAGIHQRGQQNPEFEGMGTTSTAIFLRPEGAWLAHVGDSRAYRIRAGETEQLSYDHSLQWELARRQGVDPERIQGVPSNVIVRSMGPEAAVQVDVEGPHPVLPGDIFLICSDGLSNQVNEQELGAIVTNLPLKEACQFLVDLANLRGGPDNITVVAARLPGESTGLIAPGKRSRMMPRPRWYNKIPWAGVCLGAGITLAIVALILVVMKMHLLSIYTFLVAAVVLGVGLLGLHRAYQRQRAAEPEDEATPPTIYRQSSCRVNAQLLEKMNQIDAALQEHARSKNWSLDWEVREKLLQALRESNRMGDLESAFRDQCRATAMLTAVLRQQRNKDEKFRPLW